MACTFTPDAWLARFAFQQLGPNVPGKLTSIVQVTDAGFSMAFKANLNSLNNGNDSKA